MASNNKAFVRDVKKFLKRNSMILVALFILVVALSIFTNTFLTKDNLLSVVRQCSVEAVLAFGMALVLLIVCIDLAVSSVVALSGCICVYLIEISGFPTEVAVLLTLLFGAFCGLANGLIAAFTTIPAFIITLATQQVFRGAAYLMTNGKSIMCYDDSNSGYHHCYLRNCNECYFKQNQIRKRYVCYWRKSKCSDLRRH